jgi:hypothetical protein
MPPTKQCWPPSGHDTPTRSVHAVFATEMAWPEKVGHPREMKMGGQCIPASCICPAWARASAKHSAHWIGRIADLWPFHVRSL